MNAAITGLRGMPDILPSEAGAWRTVENKAREVLRQFGYGELRTPVLEEAALFQRTIGEETDIVQKQMYTFKDRGERLLSLRPEGTASIVRSYIEHHLGLEMPLARFYYVGAMFRSERPQAGRNRQFHQIGAEAIGGESPYLDAEIITLMMRILAAAGLAQTTLKINSLGCEADKKAFGALLRDALAGTKNGLCPDCVIRYEKNILRIFDCKNETCREIVRAAPRITEHLCVDCITHFQAVQEALTSVNISYVIDPLLVRGLDYYSKTVFEVSCPGLGSQDAVAAGGRYNRLIEDLGGTPTPACGFALGVERVLMAAKDAGVPEEGSIDIFFVLLGDGAKKTAFAAITALRDRGMVCQMEADGKSLKSQMRLADRLKARHVVIIGDDELARSIAVVRNMNTRAQSEIALKDLPSADFVRM